MYLTLLCVSVQVVQTVNVIIDSLPTSDVCSYENELLSEGETWRDGPCRNCTCENGGTTKCKELQYVLLVKTRCLSKTDVVLFVMVSTVCTVTDVVLFVMVSTVIE